MGEDVQLHLWKRIAAVLLAALVVWSLLAMQMPNRAGAATKGIATSEEAIERARQLNLLAEDAEASAERRTTNGSDTWTVSFVPGKNTTVQLPSFGEIKLSSVTGELLTFVSSSWNNDAQLEFDAAKEKISDEEAIRIARNFVQELPWKLDSEWIIDPYQEGEYWARGDDKTAHKVRFDRAHKGIRLDQQTFEVYVDRITGEITTYGISWSKVQFADPTTGIIDAKQAGRLFYEQVKPFLYLSEVTNEPVYALHGQYTMDARTGKLPADRNSGAVAVYTGAKTGFIATSAVQKRLLSNYVLELQYAYTDIAGGKVDLFYRLELHPEAPIFTYLGVPPEINAKTGKWQSFIGESIQKPFPEPGQWLVDSSAAADKIGYAAAIVLNHELVTLTDEPIIKNGSVLIPFRGLMEKIGATVSWDQKSKKVTAQAPGKKVELTINSSTALINGVKYNLNTPAQLVDGRTYIPVRFVSEALGAEVRWEHPVRLVTIQTDPSLKRLTDAELRMLQFKAQISWEEKQPVKTK